MNGSRPVRISVVIATKDRARYVERALESLGRQRAAPVFEVVVVDNGSFDDTKAVAEAAAGRQAFPVRYVYEPDPNRGKARNRGVAAARGELIAFCDDDVRVPEGWLAAHDRAHRAQAAPCIVNGPILNVPSYDDAPAPGMGNYSRAYLCTCNASVPRAQLERVGGFDETFRLYGWEDTELGVRLRESGVGWKFAWDAFIWHVKLPGYNTLEVELRKAIERARMARRFVDKHPSRRARMATGAYPLNVVRAKYLLPDALLSLYAGVATSRTLPEWLRAAARAQLLDGVYTRELVRALES